MVVYESNVQGAINALNSNAITPLIGYFQINQHYSNIQNQLSFNLLTQEEQDFSRSVKDIKYDDFPSKFIWNKTSKIWSNEKEHVVMASHLLVEWLLSTLIRVKSSIYVYY